MSQQGRDIRMMMGGKALTENDDLAAHGESEAGAEYCDAAHDTRARLAQKDRNSFFRTIPGHEASSRDDVLKALRGGVLRRG